jgi:hypothetical protein
MKEMQIACHGKYPSVKIKNQLKINKKPCNRITDRAVRLQIHFFVYLSRPFCEGGVSIQHS